MLNLNYISSHALLVCLTSTYGKNGGSMPVLMTPA